MTDNERDYIGYGNRIPEITWPDKNRLAVSIVLNYEEGSEHSVEVGDPSDETAGEWGNFSTMGPSGRDESVASFFEYGSRMGVWRLLRILQRHQVSATIFACAVAFERNPAVAKACVAAGHEICTHGYRWEDHFSFSEEEERKRIRMALDSLERTCGVRPVGIFVNKGNTKNTRRIIVDEGLIYDSNSYAEDVPYRVRVGDRDHLVLPYSADTNDVRYWTSPGFVAGDAFCSYLCDTLNVLLEEATTSPRMMSIGLHMRISGRPARALALDRFITYAKSKPGVWFARRDEIARWWLAHT
jgi:peptidoglycan/xylan/chitin deacetylase (PgdA/CDA1 family)